MVASLDASCISRMLRVLFCAHWYLREMVWFRILRSFGYLAYLNFCSVLYAGKWHGGKMSLPSVASVVILEKHYSVH